MPNHIKQQFQPLGGVMRFYIHAPMEVADCYADIIPEKPSYAQLNKGKLSKKERRK